MSAWRATPCALLLLALTTSVQAQPGPAPMRVIVTSAAPDAALEQALQKTFARSPNLARIPADEAFRRALVADGRLAPQHVGAALCASGAEALIWWTPLDATRWQVRVFGPDGAPALRFEVSRPTDTQDALGRATRAVAADVLASRARPARPCAPLPAPPTEAQREDARQRARDDARTIARDAVLSRAWQLTSAQRPLTPRSAPNARTKTPERGLELPIWELRFDTAFLFMRDSVLTSTSRRHRAALEFEGVRPTARLSIPMRLAVGFGDITSVEGRLGARYRVASIVAMHLRGIYQWADQPYLDDQARDQRDPQNARIGVYSFFGEVGATVGGGLGPRGQIMLELSARFGRMEGGGFKSQAGGATVEIGYKPLELIALRLGFTQTASSGEGPLPDYAMLVQAGVSVCY